MKPLTWSGGVLLILLSSGCGPTQRRVTSESRSASGLVARVWYSNGENALDPPSRGVDILDGRRRSNVFLMGYAGRIRTGWRDKSHLIICYHNPTDEKTGEERGLVMNQRAGLDDVLIHYYRDEKCPTNAVAIK